MGVFVVVVVVTTKANTVATNATTAAANDDDAIYLVYYYLFVTSRQYNTTKEKAVSIWVPPMKTHTRIHKLYTISNDKSTAQIII